MGKFVNNYDAEGEVVYISETDYISPKTSKRIVVILMFKDRWLEPIPFEFINKSMDQVNGLDIGDNVIINYQLGGRQGRDRVTKEDIPGKYYPHVQGLVISKIE